MKKATCSLLDIVVTADVVECVVESWEIHVLSVGIYRTWEQRSRE